LIEDVIAITAAGSGDLAFGPELTLQFGESDYRRPRKWGRAGHGYIQAQRKATLCLRLAKRLCVE
jgi:hypothetical protein